MTDYLRQLKEEVAELTKEGSPYYPFSVKNMEEAITQQSHDGWLILATYVNTGNKPNSIIDSLLSDHIKDTCTRYWTSIAEDEAINILNRRGCYEY